ncbi:YfiT family bacillithiol transferase [Neobacillus terrae]|uniref:YfiT family bacillithiol transferase n=1 Tax=Neobacillus terrae TaxID=3034837 RepID=UPI0014098FD2|nr:putative metal-dependent hydrolase [Neobacillus terrae]NHM33029.1 putative metal-dependent hydrolase [Neobacillus terrae]
MEDLRYPVGEFDVKGNYKVDLIEEWIYEIEALPAKVREAVKGLNDEQLDSAYRPGGWTIRQVVHHIPDSHINSYIRFKLALTEDNPVIKPYAEDKWAEFADSNLPIEVSLTMLEALHSRWVVLLKSLKPADLEKTFRHPDLGEIKLGMNIGLYAWHGRHHLAHITSLKERMGW